MRVLVDTQSLMWFVDSDHLLTPVAYATMSDGANQLVLSAASLWEIGIKVARKKLPLKHLLLD